VEVVRTAAFEKLLGMMRNQEDKEHVTHAFYAFPDVFDIVNFESGDDAGAVQLSVDTAADFEAVAGVIELSGGTPGGWRELARLKAWADHILAQATLRAGVIGLGVGERHISGYESDARCRVVALCDIDESKLCEVSSRNPGRRTTTNPAAILNDPEIDVVSIASYDDAHYEQVRAAITSGKHVFVEKPLCMREHEFDDIAAAMAAHPRVKMSSNLILRRTPRFAELRRRIRSGELGRLYYLEGDYDYGRIHKILSGWRGTIPFYSVVHGGAIHLIDLLLWLTGGRVREVFAFGNQIATSDTGFRHNDLAVGLLKFEDGTVAKISANFACMAPHYHRLCVYGTNGTFVHGHTGAAYLCSRDPVVEKELVDDSYPGAAKGDMLPAFVAHILDGSEPEVSARDVFDAMAVALAVERSTKSGKPEKVHYAESVNSIGGEKVP
jgi:predicted dehydrogenase